jgi:centrosomal protein CEP135
VPLVERLLGDLIKTTEGFQRLKQVHQNSNSSGNFDVALKKELERLYLDNNTLHQAMIKTKESCD